MAKKSYKLNAEEIAFFCTQVGIILNAGISLTDGMEVLSEDTENPKAKELIKNIATILNDEKPLYKALEDVEVFPEYVVSMVKIGELTGRLEEVFNGLTEYYENESGLKNAIKNAIFQPLILLMMMFAVVAVLVLKVIPVFSDIFSRFDAQIGETVKQTIDFASKTGVIALVLLAVLIIVVLMVLIINGTDKGKMMINKFFSGFFITKNLFEKFATAKFCRAMTLMVKSGVDTTQSMEYVQNLINNQVLSKKIANCHERLTNNESFASAISEEKIIPGMFNQILKVSYRTGAYENAWEKISQTYDDEVNETLYRFVAMIEPILIAIITIVIGIILISVMLPLMGIMSSI